MRTECPTFALHTGSSRGWEGGWTARQYSRQYPEYEFEMFMKKYVDIDLFELFLRTFSLILWRLKNSEKARPAGT